MKKSKFNEDRGATEYCWYVVDCLRNTTSVILAFPRGCPQLMYRLRTARLRRIDPYQELACTDLPPAIRLASGDTKPIGRARAVG